MPSAVDFMSISQEATRNDNSDSRTPCQIMSNHHLHDKVPNDADIYSGT